MGPVGCAEGPRSIGCGRAERSAQCPSSLPCGSVPVRVPGQHMYMRTGVLSYKAPYYKTIFIWLGLISGLHLFPNCELSDDKDALFIYFFISVASTPHHAGHKSRHLTDVPGRSCLYTGPQPDQEGWHLALQSSTAISLAWAEGLAAAASLETPAIPFAFACSQAESCYQLPQTPGSFPLLTQRLIVASLLTSSSHPLAASPALTTA